MLRSGVEPCHTLARGVRRSPAPFRARLERRRWLGARAGPRTTPAPYCCDARLERRWLGAGGATSRRSVAALALDPGATTLEREASTPAVDTPIDVAPYGFSFSPGAHYLFRPTCPPRTIHPNPNPEIRGG